MCRGARRTTLSCVLLVAGICLADTLLGQQPGTDKVDRYGDPLPTGAIARLGTARFRHGDTQLKGLMFLPDNTTLVHTANRLIRFCDALSGRLLKELPLGSFNIQGMALSPDGRLIAIGGTVIPEDAAPIRGEVRLIEIASGKTLRTLPRGDQETFVRALTFTPDGKLLISASAYSGTLRIEEVATGTEILQQRFPRESIASLALTPDGSTLAIFSESLTGKIFLWKWASGEEPQELAVSGYGHLDARLTFSPDGKQLASCGEFPTGGLSPTQTFRSPPLRVWGVESGRIVHELTLPDPNEYVRGGPVYSPDGKTLLAPGYRRDRARPLAVHWWDAATGTYRGRLDAQGGNPLAISPDGRLLAARVEVGLRVWRWPSREEVLPNDEAHRGSISCLTIAPDATVVTASEDFTIRLWDPTTGKQKRKLEHGHVVRAVAVSPDATRLVSSSLDDTVRLWDVATDREIYRLPGHGLLGWRRAVAFSADGRSFASFGDDCYLRVWDVQTGKALLEHKLRPTGVKVPGEGNNREYVSVSEARFSPDASLLILGIGKLFVFDVKTGRELRILDYENTTVNTPLAFSPDSRRLLAGSSGKSMQTTLPDGRIRRWPATTHSVTLWELRSGQLVKQLILSGGGVASVAFSADGLRFAVATNLPNWRIAIYDTARGTEQHVIEVPFHVTSMAFAPDGRTLVSGLSDSTALVWDLP